MTTVDEALETLKALAIEFADFCAQHGNVSEADTRAKLIDAILKDVCGWPETAISREDHVDRGYTDYILSAPARRAVVVEAKREGLPFTMPVGPAKSLKLSGALDDLFQGVLVVVGEQGPGGRLAGVVVVPDRCGQGEDALQHAHDDACRGVPAMAFQVKLALEGVVDR